MSNTDMVGVVCEHCAIGRNRLFQLPGVKWRFTLPEDAHPPKRLIFIVYVDHGARCLFCDAECDVERVCRVMAAL